MIADNDSRHDDKNEATVYRSANERKSPNSFPLENENGWPFVPATPPVSLMFLAVDKISYAWDTPAVNV